MFTNFCSAVFIVLAATGAVLLLMIFLQRLIRPETDCYSLTVHLQPQDVQNASIIGYAVQRIRFFGEENCTKVYVCCDGMDSEEIRMLKTAYSMYDFVRFTGLTAEKEAENEISCK